MRRPYLVSLSLLICGSVASPASAVTLLLQERGTFARSHAIHSPDFVEDIQASETQSFEAFDAMDTTRAQLQPLSAASSASLTSSLGAQTIQASGTVTSTLMAPESDRRAQTPADSFFEVFFNVTEVQPYRLRGQVSTQATDAEAFALVELAYYGIFVGVEHTAGGNEINDFDDTGTLSIGPYRLTAFALSHGEVAGEAANPAAQASFEMIFEVPEPTPNSAAGVSLLVLAGLARAHRRSA
ncbi:MAG: hypothetical protein VX466_04305 [Myxococcota bacterium]|nr:hypothetical protein [Myxococcota bacterium]